MYENHINTTIPKIKLLLSHFFCVTSQAMSRRYKNSAKSNNKFICKHVMYRIDTIIGRYNKNLYRNYTKDRYEGHELE